MDGKGRILSFDGNGLLATKTVAGIGIEEFVDFPYGTGNCLGKKFKKRDKMNYY